MAYPPTYRWKRWIGAASQDRTGHLFLTKEVLYLLSYCSMELGRRQGTRTLKNPNFEDGMSAGCINRRIGGPEGGRTLAPCGRVLQTRALPESHLDRELLKLTSASSWVVTGAGDGA